MKKRLFIPALALSLILAISGCTAAPVDNNETNQTTQGPGQIAPEGNQPPQDTTQTGPTLPPEEVLMVDFDFSDETYRQDFWNTYLYWINWNYPLDVTKASDLPDHTIINYLHMIILSKEGELTERDADGMIRLPLEKVQDYALTYLGINTYVPRADYRNYDRETGEIIVQYWDLNQLKSGQDYWQEFYSMVDLQFVSPNKLVGTVQALDYGLEKPIESLRHYTFNVSDPMNPRFIGMELDWKLAYPEFTGSYQKVTDTLAEEAHLWNFMPVFGDKLMSIHIGSSALGYALAERNEQGVPTVYKEDVLDLASYGSFKDLRPAGDSALIVMTDTHALKVGPDMNIESVFALPEVVENALRNWDGYYDITDDFSTIFYTTEKGAYGYNVKENEEPVLLIKHPVIVEKDGDVTMAESLRYPTLMADNKVLTLRHVGYEWLCGLWTLDVEAFQADGTVNGRWLIEDVEQYEAGISATEDIVILSVMKEWEEDGNYQYGYTYTGYDVLTGKELFSLQNAGDAGILLGRNHVILTKTQEPGLPDAVDFERFDLSTGTLSPVDFHAELTDNGYMNLLHVYDDGSFLIEVGHPTGNTALLVK